MNGNVYISAKHAMQLAGVQKSQLYKMIEKKQLIAESETIGCDTRHKILVSSLMLLLEYKQTEHQAKAAFYRRSHYELEGILNRVSH